VVSGIVLWVVAVVLIIVILGGFWRSIEASCSSIDHSDTLSK